MERAPPTGTITSANRGATSRGGHNTTLFTPDTKDVPSGLELEVGNTASEPQHPQDKTLLTLQAQSAHLPALQNEKSAYSPPPPPSKKHTHPNIHAATTHIESFLGYTFTNVNWLEEALWTYPVIMSTDKILRSANRGLALIGDAALKLVILNQCYARGMTTSMSAAILWDTAGVQADMICRPEWKSSRKNSRQQRPGRA